MQSPCMSSANIVPFAECYQMCSQDIVVDYVTTMMHKAMDESAKRGKLATEDLVYLVRKVQHFL